MLQGRVSFEAQHPFCHQTKRQDWEGGPGTQEQQLSSSVSPH